MISNRAVLKARRLYKKQSSVDKFYAKYRSFPIIENMILYESFLGQGLVCNPYALFKEFMRSKNFNDYKHVWVISDSEELKRLEVEYKNYPSVSFISRTDGEGEQFAYHMATAKFLIKNSTFPHCFSCRPAQIVVHTWHSITAKKLGFDTADGGLSADTGSPLRTFLQSSYIISPNDFMTDVYKNAYKLEGIYNGEIIQEGYPRTDLILNADCSDVLERMKTRGISVNRGKKIILYAPTWRGVTVGNTINDAEDYLKISDVLQKYDKDYQVLIKPHQHVYKRLSAEQKKSGKYVPPYIDANELLSIVDILITDYSSIYFDFLHTERPILFYVPDLDKYNAERGVCFTANELPGPSIQNLDNLCSMISNIEQVREDYSQVYAQIKAWACKHDDGNVSRKVIDVVFYGNRDYNVFKLNNNKIKLLVYVGMLKNNDTAYADMLVEQVNKIDYTKFDATIYFLYGSDLDVLCRIANNARTFVQIGEFKSSLVGHTKAQRGLNYRLIESKHFEAEGARCFGLARFDYVFDLTRGDTAFSLALPYVVNHPCL
ncbi:MAG: CDP-glycerol glycerophosphotransferase family protein [Defluviitaleaceae bacterium]|nr:CDP-glycerol glycerophosphotransferase family protein [Defluviitaleaceae bacterium]